MTTTLTPCHTYPHTTSHLPSLPFQLLRKQAENEYKRVKSECGGVNEERKKSEKSEGTVRVEKERCEG